MYRRNFSKLLHSSISTATLIPCMLQVQRSRRQFPDRAAVHQAGHDMSCIAKAMRSRPSNVQLLIVGISLFWKYPNLTESPLFDISSSNQTWQWKVPHLYMIFPLKPQSIRDFHGFPTAADGRIALRAMYSCMRQLLDGSDVRAPSC